MNVPVSPSDNSEAILAQFVQELDQAADPDTVIRHYQASYPHLASQFPAMAAMMRKVERSRPDTDEELPAYLGGFRLIRRIAQGGMGEVFEAQEEHLHRRVAVKIVHRQRLSPIHRHRFLREQMVLAQLHQTNIVPIFAAGEVGTFQFFAMPYIEGAALHHALEVARQQGTHWPAGKTPDLSTLAELYRASRNPQAPVPDSFAAAKREKAQRPAAPTVKPAFSRDYFRSVAEVMADVADALQHAHDAGIIHRDVKPSNIMIAQDGKCWIIDFGLAGYLNKPGPDGHSPDHPSVQPDPLAVSGVLGTPQYMAPEQWTEPQQVDVRADVWGLGATLYELLTLQPAFTGASDTEVRAKVLTTPAEPPRRHVRRLPADLEAICLKALQKRPDQRYPTARAFGEDLRRWLRGEPPDIIPRRWRPWRQLGSWVRRNKGWAAAMVVLLVGVLGALAAWGLLQKTRADVARREALLLKLQQTRLAERKMGWSHEVLDQARQAATIRVDDNLRNQAAAALAGLDAQVENQLRRGASAIAWDRTGQRLLLGAGRDGTPSLWNWQGHEEVPFAHGSQGPVAFKGDGTPLQLLANPQDRWSVALWDLNKGKPIRSFSILPRSKAEGAPLLHPVLLAMTEDGAFLAAATTTVDKGGNVVTGHLAVWEADTGKVLVRAEAKATALSLSPGGTLLAAGDEDGQIRLWSLAEGEELEPLPTGQARVSSLAFGRNPRCLAAGQGRRPTSSWLLASGHTGGAMVVWELGTSQAKSFCYGSHWDVYALAFSPDGMTLASAGRSTVHLWDIATGRLLLVGGGFDWAKAAAFSPDGRRLAVGCDHPTPGHSQVAVFELETGRGIQTLRGLVGQVAQVCFSPDDRFVAALAHNWQLALWDSAANRLLHLRDVPKGFFADNADLCFSPDGNRFAFVTGRQAKMWETVSGRVLGSWDLPPGLTDRLAFRSEDELVLFRMETAAGLPPFGGVSWREHPRVCRLRRLGLPKQITLVAEIADFPKYVFSVVMTPQGSYLAVGGLGGPDGNHRTIRIYNGTTGKEVGTLPLDRRNSDPLLCLDPTGQTLAYSPGEGDQAMVVDFPSGKNKGFLSHGPWSLSPEAGYWISSNSPPGVTLVCWNGKRLVSVDLEGEGSCIGPFNRHGTRWARGQTDGSVTVFDLLAVQRRLAALSLGW